MENDDIHRREADETRDYDATQGASSSVELDRVKEILAAKMKRSDIHYELGPSLGTGSFGTVHQAMDTLLGRNVAIKCLNPLLSDRDEVINRFLKEARGTAQLEHPNIMPVHEVGVDDKLGIYFTMKKVEGDTLREVIERMEAGDSTYLQNYSLHAMLEIFLSVCNGVAFAHSKGVIHRDLKPANIMIGEYGEVLLLDWGLVKQMEEVKEAQDGIHLRMAEVDDGSRTLAGAISGTPNFMSPEQACGRTGDIGVQSDVYSLGAILYQMLTRQPPFEKAQLNIILENVKTGNFKPPSKRRPDLNIPRELEAICLKAMALHQINRYRSVEQLAEDVRNYIGLREVSAYKTPRIKRIWKFCKRNPVKIGAAAAALLALGLTVGTQWAMSFGSYRSNLKNATLLRTEADRLFVEARNTFDLLDKERGKARFHRKSKTEQELDTKLDGLMHDIERLCNLAQGYYEGIPQRFRRSLKVREGFGNVMRQRIEFALYCKEYKRALQWVETTRQKLDQWGGAANPAVNAYLGAKRREIEGHGLLHVEDSENVSEIMVWPLFEDGPRLMPADPIGRRKPPFHVEDIPKGSYLMTITRGDGSIMPYPVFIDHGETNRIILEIPENIPEGMAFVPGGDFFYGGEESRFYRRQRMSLPSFFIKHYEVTVAEYLEFWKSLPNEMLKDAYMSRIRYEKIDREYRDAWNGFGELADERLNLEFPVVGITLEAAVAYCDWLSEKTGRSIRLPTAEEWEKAARGVDGRRYVWGNGFDDRLALNKSNSAGKKQYPYWAPPGKYKGTDVSVYNVFDMAGNVREMTTSNLPDSDSFYQIKGGSASTPPAFLPCCYASDTPVVPSDVGFRYVQEIPHKQ